MSRRRATGPRGNGDGPARGSVIASAAALAVVVLAAAACGSDGAGRDGPDGDGADGGAPAAESPTESQPADSVDAVGATCLLKVVKTRGTLHCGVSGVAVAFSETQPDGSQRGFDADYCRVVAAAILGDADAVDFVPLTAAERFTAVQTGEVDLLMRNSTHTQSRDGDVGMDFGPVTYYDGQQLMARAADGYSASSGVADLDGAVVCASAGTTTEKNIADAAEAAGIDITLNTFQDHDTVTETFISGACDVLTTDGSGLVGRRNTLQPADQEWVIFPAAPISKEPLGPMYAQNDSAFADAVNWAVYATIIADEKGITQANADAMAANPPDAEAGRLLGGEGELQSAMGLAPDAFFQAIKQVGNYNDIWERHLVPVGLVRAGSANASWLDGGLIYAPPAR